jgi:hypothetical protein
MNPEWLPVLGLLLGGILALVLAIRALLAGELRKGLGLGAAAISMIAVAFFFGKQGSISVGAKAPPLTPAPGVHVNAFPDDEDEDSTAVQLVLGKVTLILAPAERYVLTLDGRRFLLLEASRQRLFVTCDVAWENHLSARVRRNDCTTYQKPDLGDETPDPHTLVVREDTTEVFRARYADPRRFEIRGAFFAKGSEETFLISKRGGIHWKGGGASPGTTMDLRRFGTGTIDFERSGLIRIRR